MLNDEYREVLKQRIFDNIYPDPNSGCWIWLRSVDNKGYGFITVKHKSRRAHRISHELFKAPIPDGYEIDHLCRNHFCVNPAHLEAVTTQINQHRGFSVSGKNVRKTRCKRGHEFTEENTYRRRDPEFQHWRACRKCHLTLDAQRRACQKHKLDGAA